MPTFTKEQIKEISEQLDCGFRAFYHKQTGDLIFVPNTDRFFDMDTSAWSVELAKLSKYHRDYQEIHPMVTSDSFKVMTDFIDELTNPILQSRLIKALNRKKPFREFKFVIDNSGENRQHWFEFKNKRYFEWTHDQIKMHSRFDENASH